MPLLAYCIVPAGHPLPEGTEGVGGAPVTALQTVGGMDVWVSASERRPTPGADAAREHHRVIAAAMGPLITPVPLRFGQLFPDAASAAAAVQREAPRWAELLQRFAGHAEYGARIDLPPALAGNQPEEAARDVHPRTRQSGSAYMAALAQRHAAAAQVRAEAERVARSLSADGLVVDTRQTTLQGRGVVSLAHLVAWNDASAYRSFMQKVRAANQRSFEVHFTGPWPPYSFVE